MKTVMDVQPTNLPDVMNGRVTRRRDVENEEIQMYLTKLKDLVPFMPKNRKLSKLEVIRHVIQYIAELQYTLENHRVVIGEPAELAARLGGEMNLPNCPRSSRQPLGTLAPSPNTISQSSDPSPSPTLSTESSSRSVSTCSSLLFF